MASASGASLKQRGFSAFAATRNRDAAAAKNSQAKPLLRVPAGRWRPRVRGLRASSSASSIRLKVMAAERAPTIATTIQESRHARLPVAKPCSRKASSAAVSANGKANTECSNLIISSVSQILFRMPRAMETPGLPPVFRGAGVRRKAGYGYHFSSWDSDGWLRWRRWRPLWLVRAAGRKPSPWRSSTRAR